MLIDRFHSIFHHRNWRAKGSCDVDVDQSAGSMVMPSSCLVKRYYGIHLYDNLATDPARLGPKCAITNYCDLTNSQQCLTQHSVFSGLNACSLLTLAPQCPPTSVRARNVRLPWLVSHMSPQGWRSSGQCVGGPVSGKRRFERTSTQDTQHRAQG